jgi:hypothetical protein
VRKAGKVFQCRHWTTLGYVSPNLNELQVMSQASGEASHSHSLQIVLNIIFFKSVLHIHFHFQNSFSAEIELFSILQTCVGCINTGAVVVMFY